MLKLSGVCAGYGGGADILRGVDLDLAPGSITCVVGPNGAGKSTVLKVVSGLLRPRAGTISLGDTPIGGATPRRILQYGVVHLPQERSLFPGMTVWDNLLMGAYIVGDRAEVRRRAGAIAERFPTVRERAGEHAGSLSGGQQKIVEIARSLMLEPKVILLDEPSTGLDPKSRRTVFETIATLNTDGGQTILLVEQNARAGLGIAHTGAVMDSGAVVLEAPGDQLLADPKMAELYLGGHVAAAGNGSPEESTI
jgi:branched-chain amino acid transport system ATP-binding protein